MENNFESVEEYFLKFIGDKNEFDIVEVKPEEEGEEIQAASSSASIEVERNIEQLKSITKDLVSLAQSLREETEAESNKTLLDDVLLYPA